MGNYIQAPDLYPNPHPRILMPDQLEIGRLAVLSIFFKYAPDNMGLSTNVMVNTVGQPRKKRSDITLTPMDLDAKPLGDGDTYKFSNSGLLISRDKVMINPVTNTVSPIRTAYLTPYDGYLPDFDDLDLNSSQKNYN